VAYAATFAAAQVLVIATYVQKSQVDAIDR